MTATTECLMAQLVDQVLDGHLSLPLSLVYEHTIPLITAINPLLLTLVLLTGVGQGGQEGVEGGGGACQGAARAAKPAGWG